MFKKNVQFSNPSKSTILVAGAAGLLGGHLVDSLLTSKARVIGIDDLTTGSEESLRSFLKDPNFDFLDIDINEKLPAALFAKPISHIVHLANVEAFLGRPKLELAQLLTNSFGTKNLLDLAIKQKARFVFTSTVGIYRGAASTYDLENYFDGEEVASKLSFDEAKRYAEALCHEYAQIYDLDARIARLSQVYGPGMNLESGSLLARLIKSTLAGEDLIVPEEGSRLQLLTYVSDVVFGLIKLLFSEKKSIKKGIFYFVNPEKVSVLSIAYTLKEHAQKSIKVEFLPQGHRDSTTAVSLEVPEIDLSRSKKELYWEPKVDLSDGLKLTLDYFLREKQKGMEKELKEQQITLGIEEFRDGSLRKPRVWQKFTSDSSAVVIKQSVDSGRLGKVKGWLAAARKLKKAPQVADLPLKGIEAKGRQFFFKKRVLGILGFILILLGIVFSPLLGSGFYAGVGIYKVKKAQSAVWSSNSVSAQKDLLAAQNYFWKASNWVGRINWLFSILGQKEMTASLENLFSAIYFAVDSARFLAISSDSAGKAGVKIAEHSTALGGEEGEIDQQELGPLLDEVKLNLAEASRRFTLVPSKLGGVNWDKFKFIPYYDHLYKLGKSADGVSQLLMAISELFDCYPQIFGLDEPQVYMILLQNNAEVRATGGFIGSYVVLLFDGARITKFKVDDIYNPDGLLPQDITPPAPYEKYLGVKSFGSRDANFWPDFAVSAAKVSELYELATGEKVNTVIGINLSLIEKILKVTGPVYLSVYEETISAENLFEKAELHSEIGFEPGSTKKRDFLGILTEELLNKVSVLKGEQALELALILPESLRQKDILLFSKDRNIQDVFLMSDWAGEIKEIAGDYLLVVDSNLGGNKANFWVNRSTSYRLDVDREGNLTGIVEVSWKHSGTSGTWPGGDYKNYLRVYVPKGAVLLESLGFADTVESFEESGKTVFAGLVKVPINSELKIQLKYLLPEAIGFAKNDIYNLLVQKQPGISDEKFSFKLNLPVFLSSKDKTECEVTLNQDQEFPLTVNR